MNSGIESAVQWVIGVEIPLKIECQSMYSVRLKKKSKIKKKTFYKYLVKLRWYCNKNENKKVINKTKYNRTKRNQTGNIMTEHQKQEKKRREK